MYITLKTINFNNEVEWYFSGKQTETHVQIETEKKQFKHWIAKTDFIDIEEIDFKNTGEQIIFSTPRADITKLSNTIQMKDGRVYRLDFFVKLKNGNYMSKFGSKKTFLNLEDIESINY